MAAVVTVLTVEITATVSAARFQVRRLLAIIDESNLSAYDAEFLP
jgi:hypothetical protein